MHTKIAPPPKGFDQRYYDDFLDQEQGLKGFEQRYRQITRGRFAGMIAQLDLGEMQIQRERTNCTMEQEFRFPQGMACYGFALGKTAAGHSDQGVMRPDQPHQPRAARDNRVYIEADCDLLVLNLPEAQAAQGTPSPSESRAFANWLAGVMESAERGYVGAQLLAVLPDLIADRLSLWGEALEGAAPPRAARAIWDEVLTALPAMMPEDCTVSGLSAALGRERAALRGACFAMTGQRLDGLLHARRMNAAHRALRYAPEGRGRVQEIGLAQGYTHFGRFSKAYAEMFGRLASETLRAAPPAQA